MLKTFTRLLLLMMMALTFVGPSAEAMSAADLIKAVETKYRTVNTMRAGFTQVSRNALFGDETVAGTITIKRPTKMRWEFGKDKLFVTNGTKLWVYTVADKQVIEYDDLSAGQSTAESLLGSLDRIQSMFRINVLASTDAGHTLELTPNEDGQFKKIKLVLDGTLMIKQVVITDTFDNVTEISFSGVQLNPTVDDAIFNFTPPAGVDVVRARTN